MIRKLLPNVDFLFLQKSFLLSNEVSKEKLKSTSKLFCFVFLFIITFSNAATRYSVASGNWNSTAVWSTTSGGGSGASVPVAGDDVIIEGHTITVTANAASRSIIFRNNTNSLIVNSGFSLIISAGITLESSLSSSRTVSISGLGTLSCVDFTVGSSISPTSGVTTVVSSSISNLNISGNLALISRRNSGNSNNATFNHISDTISVDGQITTTNQANTVSTFSMATGAQSGLLLLSNATPFNLSGTGTNTITLNGTGATVNYDRNNTQTVYSTTYNNLTVSNSNAKTTTGVTVNGILSLEGTATVTAAPTYGTNATLQYNTSNSRTVGVEWITPFAATGGVNVINSGTITLNAAKVFNSSIPLTISSGATLQTNNFGLTFNGNFTNSGTFTAGSSPITIAGTGTQNISGFTTTGVVSVTKTAGMATLTGTVSGGNFTVPSGPYLNLGATAFTHTASTLTLGTTQVLPGSYGGTTSAATNISSSYFASALGIVNVSTSSCSSFTTVTPITNVSFNTLNKITLATDATAYRNYTGDTPTTVAKTQYYALTVKGNTGGDVNGYYTAFIDWNNDGDFDDANESIVLGTIRNSSGTDSKVTSAYIQIPSGAITGSVKMRIIGRIGGYSTTPCVASGSTGQMQEYTITIQDACTGSSAPGNTLASANPVCSDTTLTLSLQNQSTISRAATYLWETSTDGGNTWVSATPAPNNFFFSDFTTMPASTNIYGDAALSTAPSILGRLILVPNTGSKQGGFVIQKTPGKNINPFTVNFDYSIYNGNGADGFSLSYAGDVANDAGGGESGQGSGIIVQFDTYDNEGITGGGSRVRILYNGNQLFDTALDAPFNLRTSSTGSTSNINLNVDANGVLSLNIAGTVFIANLQLPAAYLSTDKSNWKFKFSGRTGGNYDEHSIDNLSIKYLDVLNTGSTFTTTQSVPTKYRAKVTCGGTTLTSTEVTVNMISAVVSSMTASACSGVAFTVTPTNGTNGTIPSGTTYTWPAPVVTGGITGGAASTGTPTSITGTITNTTGAAQTATYTVTPTTAGCVGVAFTVTVTVNTLPVPTFTAQPGGAACANTDVTYTTQSGMSNYVWGFPGVLGTDYTITSGGSNLSNTVTLKYITATNKTVTINYTNTNGCTATSATSSTATTISPSTVAGTVGGGATVCTGTNSTTLTLTGHTGSIVRWESSLDNFATAGTPIVNTTATLTATNLTATTSYRAVVQSGSCGALNSVAATVTVSPATVAGTVGTSTTVCTGTNSTTLTLTGHTGSVVRWESSLNNFSTAGTPIVNTTATLTATNLTATTSYRAVVQSGSCGTLNSVAATVAVSPATVGGTVGGGATVCTGTNSTTLTLTGHAGSIVRWESSSDNFATAGTPIVNTTATLTATNLTATTSYRAVVQSGSCGALNSVAATVTVSPTTVAGTVGGGATVCTGTNSTTLTLTGHTGSVVRWESSLDNFATAGTPIVNTTATLTATNLTATTSYRAVVQSGSCGALNSVAATVTVSPATVAGTVGGGATVCTGTNSTTLTLTGHTGSIVRWESSLDNFATAGTPIVNTTATLTATNLTTTTSYRAVVQSGSCGALNSVAATVTVSPTTVAGTVGTSTAVCTGTNSTTLTLTGHIGSVVRWESSLNNFSTAGTPIVNTTTTLTATNLTTTTSYRAVVQSGSCGALNSISATITVNPLPSTPTPGTPNPVTCIAGGSVTLTNLPAGAWTLAQSGTFPNTLSGSGATYTVTNLAAGNYTFVVSNGTCPSLASSNVQITDQSTTTWNGTAWSNGTPDATKNVVFAGAYTIAGDLTACACTINSGVNLVVPSGVTLRITNAVNVTSGASLTFENHSSLVQVNNASVNTGNITYKRIAPQIRLADFVYWSTPVNPQTLYNVSQGTQYNMYMGFTGTNWLVTDRSNTMTLGKGYIIRGPQTYSNTVRADYQASFIGVPNNGNIAGETLDPNKFYLIGNPYPSALDASKFLAGNLFLNGTLYFWTHNTPVVLGGAYQYNADDYASYNLTGGVGTSASTGTGPGNNNTIPNGYIAAGQAFFASSASAGTVAFNNGMREGGTHNGQFFKPGKTSKEAETEKHRIWLNMTNEGGAFKQMLVGYVEGATNGLDKNFDGETFDGNVYLDFYSINEDVKYVIQGRALPFAEADKVPLGYRTTVAGDFTISIDQADGDLSSHAVYIEDKTTGIIHDLKAGKFTFTTAKGTFTDRFVLRYTNKTLGTGDFENTENDILVSVKNKVIKINSAKESIKDVTIFDVSGKLLYNKKKVGNTELQIANLQSANQVLLVKVTLDNNYTTTRKIIFQ